MVLEIKTGHQTHTKYQDSLKYVEILITITSSQRFLSKIFYLPPTQELFNNVV